MTTMVASSRVATAWRGSGTWRLVRRAAALAVRLAGAASGPVVRAAVHHEPWLPADAVRRSVGSCVLAGLYARVHAGARAAGPSSAVGRWVARRVAGAAGITRIDALRVAGSALVVAAVTFGLIWGSAGWLRPLVLVVPMLFGGVGLLLVIAAPAVDASWRARRPGCPAGAPDGRWPAARAVRAGVLAGVAAGAVYALSPLGVAVTLAVAAMVYAHACTMPRSERRTFVIVCAIAVWIRVLAIALLPLFADPMRGSFRSFFGDADYAVQRATWILNVLMGTPVAPLQAFEAFHPVYGFTGYHYVLAYLQALFGPSPYGLHMFSTGLLMAAVLALHGPVRRAFGPRPALVALALILFLPSLFLWSITPLKEAASILLMAVTLSGLLALVNGPSRRRRLAGAALVAASLLAVTPLRVGAVAIAGSGAAGGLLLWAATRSPRSALVAAALVTAVLVVAGPRIEARALSMVQTAARVHVGHVLTQGTSYRALPDEFYIGRPVSTLTSAEAAGFLARSVVAFVVEPVPVRMQSLVDRVLVPQQLVWYALVLFAVPGVVAGLRRDALLTCLLVGFALAGLAVIAPASGNIGTLVRHRDMIVPFVTWLGAFGAIRVLAPAAVSPAPTIEQSEA